MAQGIAPDICAARRMQGILTAPQDVGIMRLTCRDACGQSDGCCLTQGQRILALLFSMSAIRKKGEAGHSRELDAKMAELQRLCGTPDAAAKAMALLKKVRAKLLANYACAVFDCIHTFD